MRFLPAILLLVGALAHRQPGVYHADRQIEWLREHGGFFSEKIQFQRLNTSNTDSPMGIFAVEDIGEEETIMVIPHECLLTSEGSYDMCDTTRNLVKQRKLGNASKFAPYVDYVFDEKHKGHLPSAWSQEGKTFIGTILGDHLPPDGIADISFEANCGGSGDPLEEEAYLSVLRRGWVDTMVPVYDMINHRNGKWFNTDSTSVRPRGNDVTVFTTRKVQAGEQLYLSYNECIDCEGSALTYGLPYILMEYGFVEQYPRRWIFELENGKSVVFELDQDDETDEISFTWLSVFELHQDEETDEISFTWLSEKPSMYELQFFQRELGRLKSLRDYVSFQSQQLRSKHERDVSVEYYEALMTAFTTALEYELHDPKNETEDCAANQMAMHP